MANSFQQRSRIRKAVYGGLILVLLTVAILHRNLVVRAQADALALREESQGEVELTGSAVRLALTVRASGAARHVNRKLAWFDCTTAGVSTWICTQPL